MINTDFERYKNVIIFAKEWRGYKLQSELLDEDKFKKNMHLHQYILMDCMDTKKNKMVKIYLFDKNSKYMMSSQEIRKILKKLNDPCNVIFITYQALSTYHKKAINQEKHLNIYIYRHEIFDLILPNGPLCYPHRIMSKEEVLKLTNDDLCCYVINLPKILDEDPQCIWIGAEVGDVIEIKIYSDILGEAYYYRVVIPKVVKSVVFEEHNHENDKEELDDEIAEYKETNVNESDIESEPEQVSDEEV